MDWNGFRRARSLHLRKTWQRHASHVFASQTLGRGVAARMMLSHVGSGCLSNGWLRACMVGGHYTYNEIRSRVRHMMSKVCWRVPICVAQRATTRGAPVGMWLQVPVVSGNLKCPWWMQPRESLIWFFHRNRFRMAEVLAAVPTGVSVGRIRLQHCSSWHTEKMAEISLCSHKI